MVKVFLNGCCGRMGKAIAALCKTNEDYKIVAGCDVITTNDLSFPVFTNPTDCDVDFDVIIDFSNAKAVPMIVEYAISVGKPLVCCTTALSDETVESIFDASKKIPVFKSANMSYGMNVMFELVRQATKALYPECDIEIVEAHHSRKVDAPSGTALMIADVISEETNNELEYVYDRHTANHARDKKELGISSIRGGNIVGEHEVMFISDEEIVKISHSAQTRDVFGKGALTAAAFLVGKAPGYYSMQDIVAEAFK
ncbi:dihydrodipicolinate reductase [Ruminococcaceae bacterium YRB3002]|nr:dihydrodipicolinate reductase [Ruminococcaceae bacterium YRB3002]